MHRLAARLLASLFTLLIGSAASAQPPQSAAAVFDQASPAVVTISTPRSGGSGVIIDPAGVIVSNLHVLEGVSRATVTLANGDAYDDVSVVDFDVRKDLVLLKIKGFKLPVVELADSDTAVVGQKVFTIGAPKGMENTIAEGLISGLRDSGDGYRVIQTSAPISPGSSGGGLFDEAGRLIGVTSFKIRGGENLNFALPINYVRGMLSASARFPLSELQGRARAAQSGLPSAVGSSTPSSGSIPKLAPVYRTVNGDLVLVEQPDFGPKVRLSFTAADGYIYATGDLMWNEEAKGFKGEGTLDTRCGSFDKRVWKAPISQEIYFVNERVIRNRWSRPGRVNCDQQTIQDVSWQEVLWYVPQSK